MMKYLYLAFGVGLGLYVFKEVVTTNADRISMAIEEASTFAVIFGGTLVATHALLMLFEKAQLAAIKNDLLGGVKFSKAGTLEKIEDGSESDATVLLLREIGSDGLEAFALRTFGDLSRIRHQAVAGQDVVIEYAPVSRIVLQLRKQG